MNRWALVAVAAALPAAAHADGTPRDVIVAAAPLARLTDDSIAGRHWDDVPALIRAEKTCQAQIDLALSAGMKLDQDFEMEQVGPIDKLPHTRAGHTSLALVRAFCKAKLAEVQLLRTSFILEEAYHDLEQLKHFGAGSAWQVRLAAGRQRACAREWQRARDAGVDAGARFGLALEEDQRETSMERVELKLGDGQAKICEPLAAEVKKAAQALRRPLALAGDRKTVFEEQALWLEPAFGEGRTPLEELDDFRYTATWYVVLLDRDEVGGPAWILRSFRFDGDKLAETKESRGDGKEPPAEAFK